MKQANRKEYRVYLVGAKPEVITAVNKKKFKQNIRIFI